jgi:putative hydrolase of the HAD superfamily
MNISVGGHAMLPKAVLFDLDDTIVTYDGVCDLAWREACDAFIANSDVSFDADTLLNEISSVRKWYWSDLERHKAGRMDLNKARREIVKMALITNGSSEKQRAKIIRFGLSSFFEFCFIEEEVGFGKPDIRIFETALAKMGLKADEAWMVGDNLVWDVEAPQKVGIFAVWNDYRKKELPKDSTILPDMIIHSIAELLP